MQEKRTKLYPVCVEQKYSLFVKHDSSRLDSLFYTNNEQVDQWSRSLVVIQFEMGSIPLELLQFPEHIIQTIIDALPFKLVLCLASNGSSIFHKQLVNRVFRTVELGPFTSSNRALKVEWDSSILWERPYYTCLLYTSRCV